MLSFNHVHICEYKMLFGKYMKKHCPYKYNSDSHDQCDYCKHLRTVELNDDSTTITGIK
jgi:hypothetical protein